ncbi:hypothetical protein EDB84DRAFT_491215 [Lactarius hengduanensis]|nr:hypothetical protein EDB84DRAFT_491215 [Lactarius hengduanensis]
MTTSELALSLVAWLAASATKHDIPSAVSEKIFVGSGKLKGHDIRTLGKVVDEADVVLLMLDAHDTTGAAANWSRSRCPTRLTQCRVIMLRHLLYDLRIVIPRRPSPPCSRTNLLWHCAGDLLCVFKVYKTSGARYFIVGRARLPERQQSNMINTLKCIRWVTFFFSCPREASLTETREYRDKKWFPMLLHNVVKPDDVDDPTSDDAFRALPPILAWLQHSSTARRGDPSAHTS